MFGFLFSKIIFRFDKKKKKKKLKTCLVKSGAPFFVLAFSFFFFLTPIHFVVVYVSIENQTNSPTL